jgi:hypothetical protein
VKPRFLNSLQAFEKNLQASTARFDPRNPVRAALDADRIRRGRTVQLNPPAGASFDGEKKTIRFIGSKDRLRDIRMLQVFYAMGVEYQRGAKSLREISALWERRMDEGALPRHLPYAVSSLHRICKSAQRFFASEYEIAGEAELFVFDRRSKSTRGLTELGIDAWIRTRALLIELGFGPQLLN